MTEIVVKDLVAIEDETEVIKEEADEEEEVEVQQQETETQPEETPKPVVVKCKEVQGSRAAIGLTF